MKAVLAAIKDARAAASKLSAAMLKEYPQGGGVRWKKHGIQEGVVLWNPAPGHQRIKVHNRNTGKDVWITAYHIAEAQDPMAVALQEIEEKQKTEHCNGSHCHYLTERRCICLCASCGAAKKKDH